MFNELHDDYKNIYLFPEFEKINISEINKYIELKSMDEATKNKKIYISYIDDDCVIEGDLFTLQDRRKIHKITEYTKIKKTEKTYNFPIIIYCTDILTISNNNKFLSDRDITYLKVN